MTADPATRAERLPRLALLERSFAALPVDAELYTANAEDLRGLEGLVEVVDIATL